MTPGCPRAHPCPPACLRPLPHHAPSFQVRCLGRGAAGARRRDNLPRPLLVPAHARRRRLAEATRVEGHYHRLRRGVSLAGTWQPRACCLLGRRLARDVCVCACVFPCVRLFFIFALTVWSAACHPRRCRGAKLAAIGAICRRRRSSHRSSLARSAPSARPAVWPSRTGRARLFSRSCTASRPSRSASLPLTRHA